MLAEWLAFILPKSEEAQGRLLAAAALSCVATAALLYSLPLRQGRRIPERPASFFLLGQITSRKRLWGIGLLSAMPMWIVFFAVALAAPAAFEEAKRLSRSEFGKTVKKALGDDFWVGIERILDDIPPVLDPSVTALVVVVLLLPHVIAGIVYYRDLVCNFFAVEETASSHASKLASALLGPEQAPGVKKQALLLQDSLAVRLGHPSPIPSELAERNSWHLILAYQLLYCVRRQVRDVGARRAIEDFSRELGVNSRHPPIPLPRLDLSNVVVGLIIFTTLSAMYTFVVPLLKPAFDFLPKISWPVPTSAGRLGLATSIVQNTFSIFIPFIVGLYRHQSLVAGLRSRDDHASSVRTEYWRLFRQTAALQMALSIVMGLSVSSIRYAFQDGLNNQRGIDLHPFAVGDLGYVVIAALVPVLMLWTWMNVRGTAFGRDRGRIGYVYFVVACGLFFLLTQFILDMILWAERGDLKQTFWHHFFFGASLGLFLLLALLAGSGRSRN